MTDVKTAKSPSKPRKKLVPARGEKDVALMTKFPYRQLVGALLWIARCTRDDILYAVNQVGRFTSHFDQSHIDAVIRILGYLKATAELGLTFHHTNLLEVHAFADADYAGEPVAGDKPMHSTTGTVVTIKDCGTVYTQSILQSTVAQSTSAAEYVALGNTIQKALGIKVLLEELELLSKDQPIIAYEDNEVTIQKAKSPVVDFKLRHLNVCCHAIKQQIENNQVVLQYVESEKNIADLFTKAVQINTFLKLRTALLR